jgi:hypothetical protein
MTCHSRTSRSKTDNKWAARCSPSPLISWAEDWTPETHGYSATFLGPVSCSVFTTLPDAVCVFARGLSGEGIACFAAPDATTVVERELKADVVLSGRGDGSVLLAPGCALKVKRGFDSYISSAVPLDQLVGAKMAEQLENEASWEVVSELFD